MIRKEVIEEFRIIADVAEQELANGSDRVHHHFLMDGINVSISIWKVK